MGTEGPERDGGTSPAPAADRLWRHPAERGAEQAARNLADRKYIRRRWPSMTVSFVAGAAFVGMIWLLAHSPEATIEESNTNEVTPPQALTEGVVGWDEFAVNISQANINSVVGLRFMKDGETRLAQAILYADDGHLITSAHAIPETGDITAVLGDGRTLPARIVSTDHVAGVAVLKLPSPELDPPTFSSSAVARGDRLVGLANPGAAGAPQIEPVEIIYVGQAAVLPSGDLLARLFRLGDGLDEEWAGGPIIDENGGIVAMIVAGSQGEMWALRTDAVRRIAADLIADGETEHEAWLGIAPTALSESLKEDRGVLGGVFVRRVWDQSPAAKAGLVVGDVLVGVGSVNVQSINDLQEALRSLQPGQEVELRVVRWSSEEKVDPDGELSRVSESVTTFVTLGAQARHK